MPKKISSVPIPMNASTEAVPLLAQMPLARAAKPSTVSVIAHGVRQRAKRPGGSVAPSRTAEIGGTRVALIARPQAREQRDDDPDEQRDDDRPRLCMTRPLFGSVKPTASKSLKSPVASPRPRRMPAIEARTPMTSASTMIDQSTCLREAPSVRRVASSRVRCAIVIDSEFAITNAPTKSAMNAEREQERLEEAE